MTMKEINHRAIENIPITIEIMNMISFDKRLKEIVQKKSEPRNRNEKEIAGYREVFGNKSVRRRPIMQHYRIVPFIGMKIQTIICRS